jgi:two-component system, OmpR family, sensor histidine kinase KdpD
VPPFSYCASRSGDSVHFEEAAEVMEQSADEREAARRRSAEVLLREFGERARLVVYIAAAPGAGKTRRLLTDARLLQAAGRRVAIGWIETKGRPDLERLAEGLRRIPPRDVAIGANHFAEFDLEAALAEHPDVIILDELAHDNLGNARNSKRWQDALALRDAGITVLGAFNIAHLETVSVTAERLIGYPVREIVPLSFLKSADEVIALDASPEVLRERLQKGLIVPDSDIARAESGLYKQSTLTMLRELLLRTIDDLTIPTVSPATTSNAVTIVPAGTDYAKFIERGAPLAAALDLALAILPDPACDADEIARLADAFNAEVLPAQKPENIDFDELRASMLIVPRSKLGARLVNSLVKRDIALLDAEQSYIEQTTLTTPLSGVLGDRMRVGYGKLIVYLGAAAGAGKTYAMLDRGHQLEDEGIDVIIGYVETHKRAETEAMIGDLPIIPRKTVSADGITYAEMDRDAVLARKPQVVLVDELAHTNAPGSVAPKRFLDVLAFLRAGINVITTLNIQHLEALSDSVFRLTGTIVRETLPDGILPLADEVILIDVSPETLRERLRAGKIYPRERIEPALANFFRTENLAALRELAVREALRAETRERIAAPFDRILLSIVARQEDLLLLRKASRMAARLEVDFAVAHIAEKRDRVDEKVLADFERAARALNVDWIDERNVDDAAKRLLQIARSRPQTDIAVGGTHRAPRWPARNSFARRLLDAGALEVLVLARPRAVTVTDDADA